MLSQIWGIISHIFPKKNTSTYVRTHKFFLRYMHLKMQKMKAVKQEEAYNFKLKFFFLDHLTMFSTYTWSHLLYGFCHCPIVEIKGTKF